MLFNDGWEFSRQPLHTTFEEMAEKEEMFAPVGLPHDWLIYDTDHLYEDGTGWYRKYFRWNRQEDELVFLRFDGIYMDSRIYVNGTCAGEWKYGYSAFELDITSFLKDGENEIRVSADFQAPNSRWYSGAGIYRNVWLKQVHRKHLVSDGIYFHARECRDGLWDVQIEAEAVGEDVEVVFELLKTEAAGNDTGAASERSDTEDQVLAWAAGVEYSRSVADWDGVCIHRLNAQVANPDCWDVEHPDCYCLRVILSCDGRVLQTEEQTVGFRTLDFSPEQGFLLNGRKLKLNGVCDHHDLGCLGSAFHPQAMRRKFRILKEMGVNAVRLTHNMPAAEVMELADQMGLLIVSEAFDMWESSKTPYDYARFFPEWYKKDVASWVRRDRNHPCLIMWSIGNEIYDTHTGEKGQEWTRKLMAEVEKHDPLGNARQTIGSNYMPWENAQKCADIVKLAGYNYGEKYYDEHHRNHPDWVIYGSETSSVVQSRGVYHFPYRQSVLADEDEQCSALGNSTTSWGAKSAEACIIAERDRAYSCGQFLWSGFDYIGEPTPYHTRNSYFGQIDTAGFPKDSYYIYMAEWTDFRKNPMVHLFPYWDFNEGQMIDVRAYTNAPAVELFFNGISQGICRIDHAHGERLSGDWQIPYAKGEIRAVAYDENGTVIAEDSHHSFGDSARIRLKPESTALRANGQDLLFVEISMEDSGGFPVENANNRVNLTVRGAGSLVGTDNGDSTEQDGYKCGSRRLFGGKLLAVLKAGTEPGNLELTVSSAGLPDATLMIPVGTAEVPEGTSPLAYLAEVPGGSGQPANQDAGDVRKASADLLKKYGFSGDTEPDSEIPVRNIFLTSSNGCHLHQDNRETIVTAALSPEHASDREVIWRVVDDAGIPSPLAEVEEDGMIARITARSDGQFRLRCMSKCGTGKVRIISQLEFTVTGLGRAFLDPYGFITGGLYDYSRGAIGNGNEHGVATARDGESQVGYHEIDFGPYGSDEICIPVFALTGDPYRIRIYEGMPDEDGSELVADVVYQKPSIWNVYQEETFKLNRRLKGITSICFVLEQKVHLKGFSFIRKNRTYEQLLASDCDKVYGDSFRRDGAWIREIGNNVTLEYNAMDFGEEGTGKITVCGSTPLEKNTIVVRFNGNNAEEQRILEFTKGSGEQTFEFENICGTADVEFVFLPGSNFDFHWFRFECFEE
ncbi:MAG: glycoside hydrolase family 2 TIM barrel-domain containing protein [Lachnospiraceae bacterium]|nr:glycoside hydrolase family 2 TIM barrel-domain containing protein [Lachnospiraceae bacterium]